MTDVEASTIGSGAIVGSFQSRIQTVHSAEYHPIKSPPKRVSFDGAMDTATEPLLDGLTEINVINTIDTDDVRTTLKQILHDHEHNDAEWSRERGTRDDE